MAARCAPLLSSLLGPHGSQADLSRRSEGVLGLLFAGKWCGPCEEFVAALRLCYDQVRARGEKFEVVFVSADKDREDHDRLAEDMPWWRVDYDDYVTLSKLRCLFKIQDVPSLTLVDLTSGQTLISNACDLVRQHPDGRGFPWRPASYEQLMADGLLDPNGALCHYQEIRSGFKGLYFAANWCPPCKAFTPELREISERIRCRGFKFEIILISSDRTAESFEQQREGTPWLAVPYSDTERRRQLAERFGVQGIPSLLILDQEDRLVCRSARPHVGEDPLAERFPWSQALVEELSECHRPLLDEPLLVLFVDAEPVEIRFAVDVLMPAASAALKHRTDQSDLLSFFIGTESDVSEQVRETAGVDDSVPQLVIIDLTLGHRFVLDEGVALTAERVTDFVDRWRRRQLEPVPFDTPC